MDAAFIPDVANALLMLFEKFGLYQDQNVDNLRRTQDFDLSKGAFGARWRVANAAARLAEASKGELRGALLSCAIHGYEDCAQVNEDFRTSLAGVQRVYGSKAPMPLEDVLEIFGRELGILDADGIPTAEDLDAPAIEESSRPRVVFSAPPPPSIKSRFEAVIGQFSDLSIERGDLPEGEAMLFMNSIALLMQVADAGRTFTDFAPLDRDLGDIRSHLVRLTQSDNPRVLQDRARICRQFAESLDFRSASPEEYRYSRLGWLLALYWNSQLTRYWGANKPNEAYDFVGYLTSIQAEHRYSDADFLLLLRVSYSISRIASHDGIVPLQFIATAGDRLTEWLQYTAGTILACTGPGRVAPSRVPYDSRLAGERRDYAAALLQLWRSENDRAAAATILLEMGAWHPERTVRVLGHLLDPTSSEFEVWSKLVRDLAHQASRVRVVRPNPWQSKSDKLITVEREAAAVLAAEVVNRCYNVLGGDITLRGHDFRERRVPTYVCSADFGPIGLFKLDTAERIAREVTNFVEYAQRLHPRYRASRCDQSRAVITEPDDEKQFVRGALTSYVFTENETPQTLTSWFQRASIESSKLLFEELFERALRPWYGHAMPATIDIFSEFTMFQESALTRMVKDCKLYHDLDVSTETGRAEYNLALRWTKALLNYVEGHGKHSHAVAEAASDLQVLRSHRSVCHGDLHLDNVLVIGKPGAEYPCLIDFEATHEGYVLKDFGRFVGSLLFRTHEWDTEEQRLLAEVLLPSMLNWEVNPNEAEFTPTARSVVNAVLTARAGFLRAWQAGSFPSRLELSASLVAAFLPFARYPDTPRSCAEFALRTASAIVAGIASEHELFGSSP